MAYYLKTFDNEIIKVTKQDMENLAGKTGVVWIKSANQGINTSSIKRIIPESQHLIELREKRTESSRGVLHDGTPVVRKFGRYYLESDPDAVIDSKYFPEVARDCVATPEEYYGKLDQLPPKERLKEIMGVIDPYREIDNGGEFKQLKESLKE